jgi:hypothetical protein
MLKRLMAQRPRTARARVLSLGQEPLPFAFVARIAKAVRARQPTRIEVDWQVNAFVQFGRERGRILGRQLNARKEKADGDCRFEGPATMLFANYSKLPQAVTDDLYGEVFGRKRRRNQAARGR